jgi:hypothetical protein
MKRLRRIILSSLTVLSLLLCGGTAALWVDSRQHADFLNRNLQPSNDGRVFWSVEVRAISGQLQLVVEREQWDAKPSLIGPYWACGRDGDHTMDSLLSFRSPSGPSGLVGHVIERSRGESLFFGGRIKSNTRQDEFYAPMALIFVLSACLPVSRMILRIRRGMRNTNGHCPRCSYDLRATPDRCPECGTTPPKANA